MKLLMSLGATLAGLALLTGCSVQAETDEISPLVIAGVNTDSTKDTFESYELMISQLEQELGIPVEYYPTDSNSAIAEAAISGKADLVLVSPTTYIGIMKTVDTFDLVGITLRLGATEPGFYAIGITPQDSDVFAMSDLRDQEVCFGNPGSTTGDLLPTKALLDAGVESRYDQQQDLVRIDMSGGSALAFGAVRDGDCVAGFGVDSAFEVLMPENGDINPEDFRVFWKSELVPGAPLLVRNDLPGDLTARVKEIVLNKLNKTALVLDGVCATEGDCDYLASNLWGFVAGSESNFASLRDACEVTGYEICQ